MSNLSRSRSADALAVVEDLQELDSVTGRRILEDLPGLLAINGPIPALLKCEAKKRHDEGSESECYQRILQSLEARIQSIGLAEPASRLSARLADSTVPDYILIQHELLEYASWLKRWAQALLDKPQANDGGQPKPELPAPAEGSNG